MKDLNEAYSLHNCLMTSKGMFKNSLFNSHTYIESIRSYITSNSDKISNSAGITMPNFKISYIAIVTKAVCYMQKNRHVNQLN